MKITDEEKIQILESIAKKIDQNKGIAEGVCVAIDLDSSQFSRAFNYRDRTVKMAGIKGNLISDAKWKQLARNLNIELRSSHKITTVETGVYKKLIEIFKTCQENSVNAIVCDASSVGKTHSAKIYENDNINVVYIDCSLYTDKKEFFTVLLQKLGVNKTGSPAKLKKAIVETILNKDNPLIILDEVGDLKYTAFAELKSLLNATSNWCGWVMMGATKLRDKLEKGVFKKLGFEETLHRFNGEIVRITPYGGSEFKKCLEQIILKVARANGVAKMSDEAILAACQYCLRNLVTKIKTKEIY